MYTKEQIKKLIPNSSHVVDVLHEKYNDIKWIYYFYIDDDYTEQYIAISNKGDIVFNKYYIGIFIPEQATVIERRKNYENIEIEDDEIYFVNINKDVDTIIDVVDRKLSQKLNRKYVD